MDYWTVHHDNARQEDNKTAVQNKRSVFWLCVRVLVQLGFLFDEREKGDSTT